MPHHLLNIFFLDGWHDFVRQPCSCTSHVTFFQHLPCIQCGINQASYDSKTIFDEINCHTISTSMSSRLPVQVHSTARIQQHRKCTGARSFQLNLIQTMQRESYDTLRSFSHDQGKPFELPLYNYINQIVIGVEKVMI